jgi:hypothetical protein
MRHTKSIFLAIALLAVSAVPVMAAPARVSVSGCTVVDPVAGNQTETLVNWSGLATDGITWVVTYGDPAAGLSDTGQFSGHTVLARTGSVFVYQSPTEVFEGVTLPLFSMAISLQRHQGHRVVTTNAGTVTSWSATCLG